MVASASAHGGDRRGPGDFGRLSSCQCNSRSCNRNVGLKNLSCSNSSAYIQCQDTTCSVQACPADQLFNRSAQECQACPDGYQINEQRSFCVCKTGTRFDPVSKSCVPCPIGSTIVPDYCYCNNSAFVQDSNECKACPVGSTLQRGRCRCSSKDTFWNQQAFACQPCPGAWVLKNVTRGGFFRNYYKTYNVCECQTAGEVFNRYSVSCLACPTNSTVQTTRDGENFCSCSESGFKYYDRNNTCVNSRNFKSSGDSHGLDFSLEGILREFFGSSEDRSRGY